MVEKPPDQVRAKSLGMVPWKYMDPILDLFCCIFLTSRTWTKKGRRQFCRVKKNKKPTTIFSAKKWKNWDLFLAKNISRIRTKSSTSVSVSSTFGDSPLSYVGDVVFLCRNSYGIFLVWIKRIPTNYDWIKKIVAPKFKKNGKVKQGRGLLWAAQNCILFSKS